PINEALELIRRTVCRVWRVREDTIVSPSSVAGESGNRHELECRDTHPGELRQTRLERRVRAGLRDRADMQLVDDELLPRMTLPIVVLPLVIQWIHEHAGCMHAFRIETRCRIRYLDRIIDAI